MTSKEQTRLRVLNSLLAEHITLDQAATLMGVSTRHTRRILTAYQRRALPPLHTATGAATNRTLPGGEMVWWYRQRCGKSEEAHSMLKEDLAGGRLPSGRFGANVAWWAIAVLAFNLNSAMKQLALARAC